MKKFTLFLLLTISLLSTPVPIKAQGATNSSTQRNRSEMRERVEEEKLELIKKRDKLRFRIEEKRATVEGRLTHMRMEKIRYHWQRLKRRLLAAVDRLSKITDRILSHLESTDYPDTEEINQQLKVAQESLDQIELNIQAVDENIEAFLASENPKEAFTEIHDTIKEIKTDLVEVHRTLVQIIVEIKQAQ